MQPLEGKEGSRRLVQDHRHSKRPESDQGVTIGNLKSGLAFTRASVSRLMYRRSPRNRPFVFGLEHDHANDVRSLQIAQRVRGHQWSRVVAGSKYQCAGLEALPFAQAALHRAEQRVRIGIRMDGLKFAEKLTPGL